MWGLRNNGQAGGVPGADIGVTNAWDITVGATNVIVCVLDSGVRYTHQDLASQMWRNPGEIPGNGLDDDNDGYVDNVFGINAVSGTGDPFDDFGHGTHVAGNNRSRTQQWVWPCGCRVEFTFDGGQMRRRIWALHQRHHRRH